MTPTFHLPRIEIRRLLLLCAGILPLPFIILALLALLGPAVPEVRMLPVISLSEAQQQVSFTILQPTWLPEGLSLKGTHVSPPRWVQTFYERAQSEAGGLDIETTLGSREGMYVYPDSSKQAVAVNGQAAICVEGTWNEAEKWIASADAGALEWSTNGFFYHISHSDLGLSCADLIRIAESLR